VLLVAEGDVLGGHLRVRGAKQVLPVEVLLGLRLPGVGAEQFVGDDSRDLSSSGFVEITLHSSVCMSLLSWSEPLISLSSCGSSGEGAVPREGAHCERLDWLGVWGDDA